MDHLYADSGYASYHVSDEVQKHTAYGLGVYSFFRDNDVSMRSGIKVPSSPDYPDADIQLTNSLTVFLNGKGGIKSVINDDNQSVVQGSQIQYHCSYPDNQDIEQN